MPSLAVAKSELASARIHCGIYKINLAEDNKIVYHPLYQRNSLSLLETNWSCGPVSLFHKREIRNPKCG